MTILANLRSLSAPTTGVQRCTRSLLRHLPEVRPVSPGRLPQRGMAGHAWEQALLPLQVGNGVLWSPANTGPLAIRRQVVTIHDAATLDHPEWFHPRFAAWYRWLLPRLARRVARVVTVSEFSRGRIAEGCGLDPASITVIANSPAEHFCPVGTAQAAPVLRELGLDRPFLLVVGSIEPRKNLGLLLEVWRRMEGCGMLLAVAGAEGRVFASRPAWGSVPGVRWLGHVGDDRLAALYSSAEALLFPSFYEGFGLPVVEAMACGCRVLASDIPALREAGGNLAEYADPHSGEAWEALMRPVVYGGGDQASLRTARVRWARRWSWADAARDLMAVIGEAAVG